MKNRGQNVFWMKEFIEMKLQLQFGCCKSFQKLGYIIFWKYIYNYEFAMYDLEIVFKKSSMMLEMMLENEEETIAYHVKME